MAVVALKCGVCRETVVGYSRDGLWIGTRRPDHVDGTVIGGVCANCNRGQIQPPQIKPSCGCTKKG